MGSRPLLAVPVHGQVEPVAFLSPVLSETRDQRPETNLRWWPWVLGAPHGADSAAGGVHIGFGEPPEA